MKQRRLLALIQSLTLFFQAAGSTASAANEIEVRAFDASGSEILISGVFPKTYAAGAPIEITSITDCTRSLSIRSLVHPLCKCRSNPTQSQRRARMSER